ncbi:MAG: GTP cyclohydrolase [Bacteroidetes bacterium]|nr:GTP cyclohydrolase [Bacteroidota bacterium]
MIIIELNYKVPLEQIDAHLQAHTSFLEKYYTAGTFIASGRKVPRDGGIILATGIDKEKAAMLIKEDPFYQHGFADYKITEFAVTKKAAHIDSIFS